MDQSIPTGLKEISSLKSKAAKNIASSRIGIGFETLDREMFKPEKCYDPIALAGVKWARCQTGWSRCEKVKGQFDFAWLDEVVENLLIRGIQPWFNVGFGNKLYMPDVPHESAVGCVPLYYPKETQDAWKNFVRELTRHFQGRVRHYEIWNECNIDSFWRPGKSSAKEYAQLVEMTSKEIKSVDSTAIVVACVAGVVNDFIFNTLKHGIGKHIDRYSIHPYQGQIPEANYERSIANIRSLFAKFAPHVKLWQGECGCPSQTLGHHDEWLNLYNMDETKQAKWLLRRMLTDLALDFDYVSYFHVTDLMESEYRQANGQIRPPVMMGVLHGKSYTPKKSYNSLSWLCALFDSDTQSAPLFSRAFLHHLGRCESKLGEAAIQIRSFIRKGYPIYAYYLPEDVQHEMPVRQNFTLHYMDETEMKISEPVIVDLLQGKVFEGPKITPEGADNSCLALHGLPLTDYPLLITDRKTLE